MPRATLPQQTLLSYLFGADRPWLAADVGSWLAASPRFRVFAETYRDKIRKKVRGVRDDEGARDLAFELAVAAWLLSEPRFGVAYESYGLDERGPDFLVTFRSVLRFNVEVRRVRRSISATGEVDPTRLARPVCDKLRQLPAAIINVLALGAPGQAFGASELAAATRWLHDRANRKDEAFFQERGFLSTRDFMRHFHRLSAIVSLAASDVGANAILWRNLEARHPLPAPLAAALNADTRAPS